MSLLPGCAGAHTSCGGLHRRWRVRRSACTAGARTFTRSEGFQPRWPQEGLGIAAEHGYFFRAAGATGWESRHDGDDAAAHAWREMVLPILQARVPQLAPYPNPNPDPPARGGGAADFAGGGGSLSQEGLSLEACLLKVGPARARARSAAAAAAGPCVPQAIARPDRPCAVCRCQPVPLRLRECAELGCCGWLEVAARRAGVHGVHGRQQRGGQGERARMALPGRRPRLWPLAGAGPPKPKRLGPVQGRGWTKPSELPGPLAI